MTGNRSKRNFMGGDYTGGECWSGLRVVALIAHVVRQARQGFQQLGAQGFVRDHFVAGLAHAQHPLVPLATGDGEGEMAGPHSHPERNSNNLRSEPARLSGCSWRIPQASGKVSMSE